MWTFVLVVDMVMTLITGFSTREACREAAQNQMAEVLGPNGAATSECFMILDVGERWT